MTRANSNTFGFNGPQGQEDMSYLLMPGPVTTTQAVKLAALADRDPLDVEVIQSISDIRARLMALAGAGNSRDCVLVPGPATHAIEAALGSFAPARTGKTLIISNGADGDHVANVLQRLKRPYIKIDKPENHRPHAEEIEPLLQADRTISHLWICHCETSSGILNPVAEIATMARRLGRITMVDASATFGALPLNIDRDEIDMLVATGSTCLQSLPGLSFVIARKEMLNASIGHAHSIALDLFEDWRCLETSGQLRTTCPTHILAAMAKALLELEGEGGPDARLSRYSRNAVTLREGMAKFGFIPLLDEDNGCPISHVFFAPGDTHYRFDDFRSALKERGFSIAPGKLAKHESFRVSPIGDITDVHVDMFVQAVAATIKELGLEVLPPHGPGVSA